ncbi:hypothetical protein GCM10017782_17280 [Deinococcus ficus]|nr:hypothetical protein GCM10017782_17280 [Deinococcus ficus]
MECAPAREALAGRDQLRWHHDQQSPRSAQLTGRLWSFTLQLLDLSQSQEYTVWDEEKSQLVEQTTENRWVAGSSPALATKKGTPP